MGTIGLSSTTIMSNHSGSWVDQCTIMLESEACARPDKKFHHNRSIFIPLKHTLITKKKKEVIFHLIVSMPTMIADHFSNSARHRLN